MDSGARGCLPFLASAAAAAATAAIMAAPSASGAFGILVAIFVVTFLVAALHVALLAVPIYLWLERKNRPTAAIILPASALIGSVPVFLIMAGSGEWREIIGPVLVCGLCGIAGGLGFWLTLKLIEPPPP